MKKLLKYLFFIACTIYIGYQAWASYQNPDASTGEVVAYALTAALFAGAGTAIYLNEDAKKAE